MGCVKYLVLVLVFANILSAEEELKDFEFSDPDEMMIAQESRAYQSVLPSVRIVKPHGVTNSHRPQYDLDSYEEGHSGEIVDHRAVVVEVTTKRYAGVKNTREKLKEGQIKDAVLRALERKDHKGKFAQVLPIIRAMSGQQRVALAALVASQVNTPPGRTPLNLAQVRSMFGNADNTTADLMLPILLDMANLIRRAVRSGKAQREVKEPQPTHPQILRRSFNEDPYLDDEPFDTGVEITTTPTTTTAKAVYRRRRPQRIQYLPANTTKVKEQNKGTKQIEQNKITEHTGQNRRTEHMQQNKTTQNTEQNNTDTITKRVDTDLEVEAVENDVEDDKNKAKLLLTTEATSKIKTSNTSRVPENSMDLSADATNQTITQDLPVAEKLRAFNRFIDRKAHPASIRRGNFPKPTTRRANADPTISPVRRRPQPSRKLPAVVADQGNCELFTNTLCLHSEDYPTDAIVQSIRRNKAAAGALLADFKDPGDGALDGVTAAQEAKYTAAATANRRKDSNNREFATAGEAGFMCPSTVKYARPQRARATSGQWKYIVNTGEHTQTLRLEKCLKPKESCTFLTDNFKSKCVQVYNYHRLLTWDQQNGLHMDIFKVPTCCSCHIEGYSVSFPPLGHRVHETSSNENFPGEDLSAEHGNQAFEQVQPTIQRPTRTPPFLHKKPIESFPPYTDNQNLITANQFQNIHEEEFKNGNIPLSNPMDSYGNTYFPDSYNQATSIRQNVKRPPSRNTINTVQANNFDQITLPSYLEPPTPSATSTFFTKENSKFKPGNPFKRGGNRNRRPIRKKIGGGPDDLTSSGTSAIGNLDSLEDFNDDLEEPDILKPIPNPNVNINNLNPSKRGTIAPKLQAASTEGVSTTFRPDQKPVKENISVNGKRVNYNYHPIIDFFEEGAKDENQSIDREDSVPFVRSETEWKPLSVPPSRTTSNLGSRSKHK